ncbi:MAG: DoxX family protein [Akkermansiaceae bacterium]|nr:DoxX family protein [Akkermansiaceae bacterium]
MKKPVFFLILRVIVALILLQTLFFKFTGAEESVKLFSMLSEAVIGDDSLEALMRIGSGVVELVTAVLLLMKKPAAIAVGSLMAVGTMAGAIVTHLSVIGVDYGGGPVLFIMAVVTMVISLVLLFRFRGSLPMLGKFT